MEHTIKALKEQVHILAFMTGSMTHQFAPCLVESKPHTPSILGVVSPCRDHSFLWHSSILCTGRSTLPLSAPHTPLPCLRAGSVALSVSPHPGLRHLFNVDASGHQNVNIVTGSTGLSHILLPTTVVCVGDSPDWVANPTPNIKIGFLCTMTAQGHIR